MTKLEVFELIEISTTFKVKASAVGIGPNLAILQLKIIAHVLLAFCQFMTHT